MDIKEEFHYFAKRLKFVGTTDLTDLLKYAIRSINFQVKRGCPNGFIYISNKLLTVVNYNMLTTCAYVNDNSYHPNLTK